MKKESEREHVRQRGTNERLLAIMPKEFDQVLQHKRSLRQHMLYLAMEFLAIFTTGRFSVR